MDLTFDFYGDLEEFQEKVQAVSNCDLLSSNISTYSVVPSHSSQTNKEVELVEEKYQKILTRVEELDLENHALKKDIKQMELNFQSLLDTARAEIKRKDNEIAELRQL